MSLTATGTQVPWHDPGAAEEDKCCCSSCCPVAGAFDVDTEVGPIPLFPELRAPDGEILYPDGGNYTGATWAIVWNSETLKWDAFKDAVLISSSDYLTGVFCSTLPTSFAVTVDYDNTGWTGNWYDTPEEDRPHGTDSCVVTGSAECGYAGVMTATGAAVSLTNGWVPAGLNIWNIEITGPTYGLLDGKMGVGSPVGSDYTNGSSVS